MPQILVEFNALNDIDPLLSSGQQHQLNSLLPYLCANNLNFEVILMS